MRLSDFDYELPEALIAQQPLPVRRDSRLLVLDREQGGLQHCQFSALPALLAPGDVLVRNETRVIPARLIGRKPTGGQIEALLVQPIESGGQVWRCMIRSSKPVRSGVILSFAEELAAEVLAEEPDGCRILRFICQGDFLSVLEEHGRMPLPPYIRRAADLADKARYQTVFAREPGAVAAPTAGLHFDGEMFATLADRGIEVCGLTLHVGLGTFLPVRSEDLEAHRMHGEWYDIPDASARLINRAKAEGRRVIALGTTSTRALEDAAGDEGQVRSGRGLAELFIRPGFRFQIVNALLTNFHLPKSTLLMLVSAFAGREAVLAAYREAVARRYRFFSYGDCMLIQ